MGLSDRDYMRGRSTTSAPIRFRRRVFASWAQAALALCGVLILSISAIRLLAVWGVLRQPYFAAPAPWLFRGQTLEVPLVLIGVGLATFLKGSSRLGLVLALFVSALASTSTAWNLLSSRGHADVRGFVQNLQERLFWRGEDGEMLVVYPHAAKPGDVSVQLTNNPEARNPSYRQLLEFLRSDPTDTRTYIVGEWVCVCFAEELHNNAERAGIRCALVTVELEELHALNAFRTSDHGMVFVDCTSSRSVGSQGGPKSHDCWVDLQREHLYIPRFLFPSEGWGNSCESMGVVRDFKVYW